MSQPHRRKVIARLTPTLGAVSDQWSYAAENLIWPNNWGKLLLFGRDEKGGEIAETRNRLVQQALSLEDATKEIPYLFWVDDDVVLPRFALVCLLNHALEKKREVVSGVYFTKGPCGQPLIFPGRVQGYAPFVPDRVFDVWGHGMGLCVVATALYRRMLDAGLPLDRYGRPQWYKTPGTDEAKMEDGMVDVGGTEDLYFLDAASRMGVVPLMDTGKWAFGFHYDLGGRKGYPERQWEQLMAGKPVTWDTAEGEVVWE